MIFPRGYRHNIRQIPEIAQFLCEDFVANKVDRDLFLKFLEISKKFHLEDISGLIQSKFDYEI